MSDSNTPSFQPNLNQQQNNPSQNIIITHEAQIQNPTQQQVQLDAYLQLLSNFVSQSEQQEAFGNFLNEQKQVLVSQQQQLIEEEQQIIQQRRSLNENTQMPRSSSFTNATLPRTNTLTARTSFTVMNNKPQGIPVSKEVNDEKIKRMRAYQSFLRIQENEKNSGGLLEDFGSSVLNILKLPSQIKMPQFMQGNSNSQQASGMASKRESEKKKVKDSDQESSIQLVSQKDKDESIMKNSRASEMQIIVDTSRIITIPDDYNSMSNQKRSTVTPTNFVLGQQELYPSKDIIIEPVKEDEKFGVYFEKDFNYSDYLGDLNLRQIQQNKNKTGRWLPLYPDSNFKITWDLLGFAFIIYQAMIIPYRFCYKSKAKGKFLYFETAIDIFFMFDLVLSFVSGYYKRGHVIMKRGVIIKHYLRTWFIIDILATFPYSWIIKDKHIEYWPEEHEEAPDTREEYNLFQTQKFAILAQLPPVFTPTSATDFGLPALLRLLKLVRLIRLYKMFQIFKLRKFVYRYEWFFFNDTVTVLSDLFKVLIAVLFILHWMSCIFFLIADIEDDSKGQATWLLLLNKDDLKSAIDVYIASISWAFTTVATVGYGDIYAVTEVEKVFAMLAMMISCGIFAYIVGFLGALFDRSNQIVGEYQKKVKRYLIYLMYNKRENKLEENEVFDLLSDNLKQELIIHLNGKMLHQNPPFNLFKLEFLLDITFILKRETFTIDERLFDEDDTGDHLHYVTKGHVNLTQRKTATYIKEISYDTFLGELSFFTGLPRKASAKSKNFTETLTLFMNDFMEAIQYHPDQLEQFSKLQQLCLTSEDYTILGVSCYICNKLGHISVDCSEFSTIKGNLREIAMEKMKQNALKKKLAKEKYTKKEKKERNEDSIVSFEAEYNNSSELQDNSITEMFNYLEKRYKKDETMNSPKRSRQEQNKIQESPSPSGQGNQDTQQKTAKINHLAQIVPLTESSYIQNLKNEKFLKPANIDQIEENSNEESVISRESLLMRQSIESQISLINKLTEIQTFGRSSERPLGGNATRSGENQFVLRSQSEINVDFGLDKLRHSRGYQGQSIARKRKNQDIEQIDEEEDDEMIMQRSITDSPKYQKDKKHVLQPLEDYRQGGSLQQLLENQQELEELRKQKKEKKKIPLLIGDVKHSQKLKSKKKVGQIPKQFYVDPELVQNLIEVNDSAEELDSSIKKTEKQTRKK